VGWGTVLTSLGGDETLLINLSVQARIFTVQGIDAQVVHDPLSEASYKVKQGVVKIPLELIKGLVLIQSERV